MDVNEAPKFSDAAPTALTVTENETVKQLRKPDGVDAGDDPDDLVSGDYVATDGDGL